jgi:molybdate transport system substrate-binding protein
MNRFLASIFSFFAIVFFVTNPSFAATNVIHVFAAASLKETLESAAKLFSSQHDIDIKFSFASSSVLAKQIEAGAPADLFASADITWMDYLDTRQLIQKDSRIDLLGNALVVVSSRNSEFDSIALTREAFSKILTTGRLVTGEVNTVPVGVYAKAALTTLSLWPIVEPRLAQAENVRAALAFVSRGEVEIGIVYKTDALVDSGVKIIATIPRDSHDPIVYPFALTATSTSPMARKFLDFLNGPEGKTIFVNAGFDFLGR